MSSGYQILPDEVNELIVETFVKFSTGGSNSKDLTDYDLASMLYSIYKTPIISIDDKFLKANLPLSYVKTDEDIRLEAIFMNPLTGSVNIFMILANPSTGRVVMQINMIDLQ